MASFFVINSLNYSKAVKFNITLRYFVVLGEQGEHKWVLEIGTTYKDASGNDIPSKKINNISTENLDIIIEEAVADMCSNIDWSPLVADKSVPYVDSYYPEGGSVSIGSNIFMVIKDKLPSAGIDVSNMNITLNNSMQDFDITSDVNVTGDPYEYTLRWNPLLRVYSRYDN